MGDSSEQSVRAAVTPEAVEAAIRRRGRKGMTVRMLVAEVVDAHAIGRSEARQLLRRSLRSLLSEGKVVEGRGKRYFVAGASDLLTGVLRRRRDGDVVEVAGSRDAPVHIPPKALHGALDGDRVLVRLETARKRAREAGWREGIVVRVLERARTTVVGRWVTEPGRPHVRPLDDKLRLRVYPTAFTDAGEPEPGEFVVVTLEGVSTQGRSGRGAVVEHLGRLGEPGVEERVVLRVHGIPETYPPAVLGEAEALPATISPADLAGRSDLRDRPVITIDPETARDFDDAISARRGKGDDIVVEVHIADVSHYVAERSELDREARRRGTSVYLPGTCIAMLPERVSNELCSLREGVDRLVYTVRFTVRRDGSLTGAKAMPAVIRSRRRCTYGEVFSWLETPRERWPEETSAFAESLEAAAEAAERLGRLRRRRGSLDFDLAEPQILLDPEGRVVSIEASARNRAHRLIEELMVAANRCVAQLLVDADQPALHRVHDRPDPTRVEELESVLSELGYRLDAKPSELRPIALQRVLEEAQGRPEERLVAMLVLRTLARALYSPEPRGHYALAADAYLHFTSPIRRYPDLVVHRMLRRLARDGGPVQGEERKSIEAELVTLGESCSAAERRAEAAERMAVQWKTILYLRDREGDVFDGTVSGVTEFGFFVQLDETFVDGLVHVSELVDDYYDHDQVGQRLVGERSGRTWRLGDRVRVRLVRVDLDAMRLELAPTAVRPDARARQAQKDGREPSRRPRRGGRTSSRGSAGSRGKTSRQSDHSRKSAREGGKKKGSGRRR